jgi:predicted transcriptional regulator
MKAVWERPPVTVKDVHAAIRPHRKLAYTTVMTIMHRMFNKGVLTRKLEARTHYYEPAISYIQVRDAEVARLLDNFFAGSKERLIDFLDTTSGHEVNTAPPGPAVPDLDETLL